jgi:hypothetical protein
MKRSILEIGVSLACLSISVGGCSPAQKQATKGKPDDPTAWSGSSIKSSEETASGDDGSKSLFKSSRLSGAMSDEGRDIERSLGVH